MTSPVQLLITPWDSTEQHLQHISTFDQNIVQVACVISNLRGEPELAFYASPSFHLARATRTLRLNVHRFYRESLAGRAQIYIRYIRRILVNHGLFEDAADVPHGPIAHPSCLRGQHAVDWLAIRTMLGLQNSTEALLEAFEIARSRMEVVSPHRRSRNRAPRRRSR